MEAQHSETQPSVNQPYAPINKTTSSLRAQRSNLSVHRRACVNATDCFAPLRYARNDEVALLMRVE